MTSSNAGMGLEQILIAPVTPGDSRALARLHAMAFPEETWTRSTLEEMIAAQGARGLMATGADGPRGFILLRQVAGEAEILTLAVHRKSRRIGVGALLLEAAIDDLKKSGVAKFFLEVAADNMAAISLYEKKRFIRIGLRRGYYQRKNIAIDAIMMARSLEIQPSEA